MWLDLLLLNLMAIFGCFGLSIMICLATNSSAGFIVMGAGLIFANWAWWSVYFNDFKWLP